MPSQTNILTLPVAVSLDGSEYVPIVQGGVTRRASVSTIGQFPEGAASQSANTVYAGPTSGSAATPSFRALVAADLSGITLPAANGGTGIASYTVGDILYASGATTLAKLAGVVTGRVLRSGGVATAPAWGQVDLATDITGNLPVANLNSGSAASALTYWRGDGTWATPAGSGTVTSVDVSGGSTGITASGGPITGSGTITLAGTLVAANGGTGITSYAVGDLIYASGATTLAKLADIATGNALLSGGVGVAPAWGKIGLTTHVSGTLPVANGGTGVTSLGTLTKADDTNVTVTLGGTPTGALINAVSLTMGWSGQLAINRGGTAASTATAAFDNLAPTTTRGDLIFRNATTNARLAASTSGYLLQTNGAGTDPTWSGFLQAGTGATTLTWQTKLRQYVNVADFGAVGDGATDDRVAIQAAIDATPAGGTLLFGPYTYAVSKAAGAYCLTRSSPITMIGTQATSIKPLASATSTVDVIYLNGAGTGVYLQTIIDGIFFGDNTAGTRNGRHAIVFDTQAAGAYFGRPIVRNCYLQQSATTGAFGIFHVNSAVNNPNGGLYGALFEGNTVSGISLNASGDSIWVANNLLTGNQAGVYANLVADAGNLVISQNNSSAAAGAVVIDRCVTASIIDNEFEQQVTNTVAENAIIVLRGTTATLGPVAVLRNMVQDTPGTGDPYLVYVGAADAAVIDQNRFATSTSRSGVIITASASGTIVGAANKFATGTPVITNNDTTTLFSSTTYLSGNGGSLPAAYVAGTTYYAGQRTDTTESLVAMVTSVDCTFRNLYVYSSGSPGGVGATYVCTLRTGLATDTALTATIVSGLNSASDTTNAVTVAAGTRFSIKIATNAAAVNSPAPFIWAMSMTIP